MEKILYCIRKKPLEEEDLAFYRAELLITVSDTKTLSKLEGTARWSGWLTYISDKKIEEMDENELATLVSIFVDAAENDEDGEEDFFRKAAKEYYTTLLLWQKNRTKPRMYKIITAYAKAIENKSVPVSSVFDYSTETINAIETSVDKYAEWISDSLRNVGIVKISK